MNAEDALEFLMAGATAIQIGTANLVNPRAPMDILEGLEAYAKAEGLKSIREIVGVARG
ncbi:dihydroorotate dehydrogenase (NAD(+)), catalytic subunit [Dehalococcoides mccartyi]|jgi:dihydroorotate dehydrogenase (NAD+) catalytic subunit|nr:hypothetical protein [Dehalococcoides mccartyi]BCT56349.1 dihydroorotate dehydrogenase (NAD(+)), catalytic subunit [Dehalococcoides mccartyi]